MRFTARLDPGQEPIKQEYREVRPALGTFLMGGSPGGKLPGLEIFKLKGLNLYHLCTPHSLARPRPSSPALLTYLQVTVFWGGGAQVGVIGLVQQLCEESPRELLGCEWVLED